MMIGNLMLWPKIPKFGDLGSMLEKQKLVKKFQISQILKNLGCFGLFCNFWGSLPQFSAGFG